MTINDLSVEDRALVVAFADIARAYCAGMGWTAAEPMLAESWGRLRHSTSPEWRDIAVHVRIGCEEHAFETHGFDATAASAEDSAASMPGLRALLTRCSEG